MFSQVGVLIFEEEQGERANGPCLFKWVEWLCEWQLILLQMSSKRLWKLGIHTGICSLTVLFRYIGQLKITVNTEWRTNNVNAVLHLLIAHQRWHTKRRSTFIWTSSGNTYRKKKRKSNETKQTWKQTKSVLKGLRVGVREHLAWFGLGQTAVTTDTDVRSRSFSVWAVVSWFLTDVCKRSCSDVTRLIFPSAEHQQGFTVVSWCVALHRDGKHTEERLRMAENRRRCLPTLGQLNLESFGFTFIKN